MWLWLWDTCSLHMCLQATRPASISSVPSPAVAATARMHQTPNSSLLLTFPCPAPGSLVVCKPRCLCQILHITEAAVRSQSLAALAACQASCLQQGFNAEFRDQNWAHHSYAKFAPKGNSAAARASQAVNVRDSLTMVMPLLTCGINVTAIHPHQVSLLAKAGSQADASDLMSALTSQYCT